MNKHRWSAKEDLWLLTNRSKYRTYAELSEALNNACGVKRTGAAVKCRLNHRYGCGLCRPEGNPYTDVEQKYIEENYKRMSLRELADGIHMLTGRSVTAGAIGHYMSDTIGIKRFGRTGPISKGETIGYVAPIGSEYVNNDGYTFVKIGETGIKNKDWKTKQTVMWEKYYGSHPNGIVVFLNGDRTDFSNENLYCMDRKIHAVMNSNGWYTNSREHTLTAIRWCELFYALKEITE